MRPSALPMLAECPKFEGDNTPFAKAGVGRHKAIAAFLKGDEKALDAFEEEVQENLTWAADYIKLKAPLLDHPLVIETQKKAVLPNGIPIEGTPDFVCGPILLDLKWRPRDYSPQMAAYAWMILDEGVPPPITAILLFGQTQSIRTLTFDADSAWAMMKPIIEGVDAPFAVATPCSFCGWCAKKLNCNALIQQVNIALQSNPEWNLPQWHSSEMTTAREMGLALRIARTLTDWCESVEFHAKEMARKQGIVAEGYKLTSRRGNRFIDDILAAFHKANLPQEQFLKTCTVKPKALFECYASFHGLKKTNAEREVELRLGDSIKRKEPSTSLVENKAVKEEPKD
jgi:hypothetical protein